jgi:hypothetical protein
LSTGTIWGAIGSARFFGPGSPYFKTLFGFLIGLVAPIIPWYLHRLQPDGFWHIFNVPLIAIVSNRIGSTRSDMITPIFIAILVNFFIKRYNPDWWQRYALIMAAAFDVGSALTICFVLLVFTVSSSYKILMPFYALNRIDQESCAPNYFLTCMEQVVWSTAYGGNGTIHDPDPMCHGFGNLRYSN